MSSAKTRQVKRSASDIIKDIQSYYENGYYTSRNYGSLKKRWRKLLDDEKHDYIISDNLCDYFEFYLMADFDFIHESVHFEVMSYIETLVDEVKYKLENI